MQVEGCEGASFFQTQADFQTGLDSPEVINEIPINLDSLCKREPEPPVSSLPPVEATRIGFSLPNLASMMSRPRSSCRSGQGDPL